MKLLKIFKGKPLKRVEGKLHSKDGKLRLRASRTSGLNLGWHPLRGLTFNTKHGVRVSKTFKGLTLGFQSGNSVVRGRWSSKNQFLNVNLSKSGFSLSSKSNYGNYNFTNPNRSSFKFAGIQIRGKKAKNLALMALILNISSAIITPIFNFLLHLLSLILPILINNLFNFSRFILLVVLPFLILNLFNLTKLFVNILTLLIINFYNLFLFLILDIPKQILNIVFRREIFDLRADLSDQIDDQKIKSIDLDQVKLQLTLFGAPYKEVGLFKKSVKLFFYFLGWLFTFIGGLMAITATLGYFQILSYENDQVLNIENYLFLLVFSSVCIFIGYISKIWQRKVIEQKKLEAIRDGLDVQKKEYPVDIKNASSAMKLSKISNKQAVSGKKDRTNYNFNNKTYNKSRLPHAIIKKYIEDHPNTSYAELLEIFPQEIGTQVQGFIVKASHARQLHADTGYKRHYIKKGEIIKLIDEDVAVSNQWGPGNINNILDHAKKMDIQVTS